MTQFGISSRASCGDSSLRDVGRTSPQQRQDCVPTVPVSEMVEFGPKFLELEPGTRIRSDNLLALEHVKVCGQALQAGDLGPRQSFHRFIHRLSHRVGLGRLPLALGNEAVKPLKQRLVLYVSRIFCKPTVHRSPFISRPLPTAPWWPRAPFDTLRVS